jgi:hypothetical protein
VLAAVVAVIALTLLILSARLHPSPDGHGTHSQLGLPPCGWVIMFNKPCPTCGMTTSFAHLAHGQVLESLRAQPAGTVLAVATAAAFWIALHAALTASRAPIMFIRLLKPRFLWILAGFWLASWVYKIVTWPAAGAGMAGSAGGA